MKQHHKIALCGTAFIILSYISALLAGPETTFINFWFGGLSCVSAFLGFAILITAGVAYSENQ